MTNFLIANKYRKPGLAIFLLGTILAVMAIHFEISPSFLEIKNPLRSSDVSWMSEEKTLNLLDEIGVILLVCGLLMLGFSKEKTEDEYHSAMRLYSLQYSIVAYSIILLLAVIFVHGSDFLWVMTYCMILPLILFVARYYFLRWRNQKELSHEE